MTSFFRLGAFVAMLVTIVAALGGCVWPPARPGCDTRYEKGGEWDLGGIKIPINAASVGTVEIAKVKYTGPQAQKLSDAVSAMDVGRQGLCAIIYSPGFSTMSEIYRATLFDKLIAINQTIVSFGQKLSTVTTPAEGQRVAEETIKEAGQIVPPPASQPSLPPASSFAPSTIDQNARNQIDILKAQVDDLRQLVSPGTVRLEVQGFEVDGTALPAEHRQALFVAVNAALKNIPVERTPNLLIVGYADASGEKNYNLALALRRAEFVAEFLRRQDFGRGFHTEVTSGGIFNRIHPAVQARRVEILVSRAVQNSWIS